MTFVKVKNVYVLSVLILDMIGFVFSGCTSSRLNLIDNGTFYLEQEPSSNISIFRVHAYLDGDELVINGRVKRRCASFIGVGGHIDIAIVSPEGEILEQVSTFYIPRIIPRKRAGLISGSHFEVRLPAVPPAGSTIRVKFHRAVKSRGEAFDCRKNAAGSF